MNGLPDVICFCTDHQVYHQEAHLPHKQLTAEKPGSMGFFNENDLADNGLIDSNH